MLKELMTYSGMTAKIKAMRGHLLKNEDYYTIASMQSVDELQAWLKNYPGYVRVFRQVQDRKLHRGDIEKLLQLALYEDYGRIFTFAGPAQRKSLKVQVSNAMKYRLSKPSSISYSTIGISPLIPRSSQSTLPNNPTWHWIAMSRMPFSG